MRYYVNTATEQLASQKDLALAYKGEIPEGWVEVTVHRRRTPLAAFLSRTLGVLLLTALFGLVTWAALSAWKAAAEVWVS